MSKYFRRISIVALVMIMVCLLATSVLAQTSFYYSNSYDNGNASLVTRGSITATATQGSVSVSSSNPFQNYVTISVTYHYYPDEVGGTMQVGTNHDGDLQGSAYVSSNTSSDIFVMYDATYTVYAEFPTSYGTERFEPDEFYLKYEP